MKTEMLDCMAHLQKLHEAHYCMIAKGCNMSVRDETGPSEALYIDPTNATFHPVGEWMKNFELEWEML